MASVKGQIPVQGVCRDGHTTNTTSDKGRVTWEGPCSHDGCAHKVKARRIPGGTPAGSADPPPSAGPSGTDDPYRVIEVEYDRDDPDPGPRADGAGNRTEQPAEGEDPPAGVEQEPGAHHAQRQSRRVDGRWRRRKPRLSADERARAREAVDQEWIVPGVLPR